MGALLCGNTAEVPWQWSAASQRCYASLHFLTPVEQGEGAAGAYRDER